VNTLSMFGLVLGHRHRGGRRDRRGRGGHAPHRARDEPARGHDPGDEGGVGPVIGIALILSAVFIPVAFIAGLTGQMYQQFALTIAISVLLSAFSALSLSPRSAAMLLKPRRSRPRAARQVLRGFNKVFDARPTATSRSPRCWCAARSSPSASSAGGGGRRASSARAAAGFIPEEDQGIFGVNVTLPPARRSSAPARCSRRSRRSSAKTEGVESYQTIGGYGVVTSTYQPNFGTIFIRSEAVARRHGAEMHVPRLHGAAPARSRASPTRSSSRSTSPTISGFGASPASTS
jgi:multidrug efflux pump subunit AcrB